MRIMHKDANSSLVILNVSSQTYNIPLVNGEYQIQFIFLNQLNSTQSTANISVEGKVLVQGLGSYIIDKKAPSFSITKSVEVKDGGLTIAYSSSLENVQQAVFLKYGKGDYSSEPSPMPNQQPVVSLSMQQTEYELGKEMILSASAKDVDGKVDRVLFYANRNKIGEIATLGKETMTFSWKPSSSGEYLLYAKAIDNEGAESISEEVKVLVSSPTPSPSPEPEPSPSPTPTGSVIEIIAAGNMGDEIMGLSIGSQQATQWTVGSGAKDGQFHSFVYEHDQIISDVSSLQIHFKGGHSGASDLRVDKLILDGNVFETEANDTYSTGTWESGNTILPGYKQSEWLHALGYFQYKLGAHPAPVPNQLPVVSLVLDQLQYEEGQPILLKAVASDEDGTVTQLDFLVNGNKVHTLAPVQDTVSFVWQQATAGTYIIQAVATDNEGEEASADAVEVIVELPQPKGSVIEIIAAGNMGDEIMGLSIGSQQATQWTVGSGAKDGQFHSFVYEHDQIISDVSSLQIHFKGGHSGASDLRVDKLILDGKVFETEANDTYSTGTWESGNTILPGYKQSEWLHALGYFQYKLGAHPAPVPNQLPVVSLVLDQLQYEEGQPILLKAVASDEDGTVTQLDFLVNGNKVHTLAPVQDTVSFVWQQATAGTYIIQAVATDNEGEEASADAVEVIVELPQPKGSVIEIIAAGNMGDEIMGLSIGSQQATQWTVGSGAKDGQFHSFVYEHDQIISDVSSLQIHFKGGHSGASDLRVDKLILDGNVFETEANDTYSTGTWESGNTILPGYKQSEWLHALGYFQYKLGAHPAPVPNQLPVVSLVLDQLQYEEGQPILLKAVASDEDGTVTQLDFLVNGNKVHTLAPVQDTVSFVWQQATAGTYIIQAVATDNEGEEASADAVEVIVELPQPKGSVIEIIAAGNMGDEIMGLSIGSQQATQWTVGSGAKDGQFHSFVYEHDQIISDVSSLQIHFKGGHSGASDLRVDKLILDGKVFETEANDTYSTGTWESGNTILPGYKQSEWLHALGYFQYKLGAETSTARILSSTDHVEGLNYSSFNIFPNPIVNEFSLTVPEYVDVDNIQIYNLYGVLVYSKDFSQSSNVFQIDISNYNLPEGRYALVVILKDGTTKKFNILKKEPM
ncbi:Ig-like domain-containing protein [Catalinimonas niigatensis]|uniref:Ig-like domain-containing protein n=1 Tax=Catalinimonas niigatensis TaxID=1397264 RepID=UPI002666819B|nr:Ig-like domain-containing protein [Catalinimonas niigatensis]WPP51363.1 T9SS type A sorting domain-containing protein [Catalinimonas niigatensis]